MPSDVAKIIAVKKSRKDFTIRISKFPLIPSFIAPKIPVPLNENKTTIATNLDKNSSWLFMLLGLSGNIFSTRPFADEASLLIRVLIKATHQLLSLITPIKSLPAYWWFSLPSQYPCPSNTSQRLRLN